jgi:hypothetical protein
VPLVPALVASWLTEIQRTKKPLFEQAVAALHLPKIENVLMTNRRCGDSLPAK